MHKTVLCLFLFLFCMPVVASDMSGIERNITLQNELDEIGTRILNANKIDKHITFYYNEKDHLISGMPEVTRRQVNISPKDLQFAGTEDEKAALLARQIFISRKSFDGAFSGVVSALQIKVAPKKYEVVSDRRAVEYLVKAGYNPLGLITFINKSCPQARQDKFSNHNLTSKRLMYIYEKIYFDYPYFISNNSYIDNPIYQNFLLTSIQNRKNLGAAAKSGQRGSIRYE